MRLIPFVNRVGLRSLGTNASQNQRSFPRQSQSGLPRQNTHFTPPLPQLSLSPTLQPEMHKPTSGRELVRHLSALLTRHGKRGEPIVVAVNQKLQVMYRVENPIQVAIDAIKPVIKYYKSKSARQYIPLALFPKTAEAMAMRWLIEVANTRTYIGGRPDIVRALVEEIDSIIQGSSSIFTKRFNIHRNPN